jgi:hypothetical protein
MSNKHVKFDVFIAANTHIAIICIKTANVTLLKNITASIMLYPNNVGNQVPDYTVTSKKTDV